MKTNQPVERVHQDFSNALSNALVGAMTEACGSPWSIMSVLDAAIDGDGAEAILIKLAFSGSLQGDVILEFKSSEATALTSKVLQASFDGFGEEQSGALLKLIETGCEAFRSALEQEYGTFAIDVALASEPVSDRSTAVQITAANEDSNCVSIVMYLSLDVNEALNALAQPDSSVGGAEKVAKFVENRMISQTGNLDLVMDVELNVTLRFGRRRLTLREVLELTSGSVVELDRQVEEPVELLLDGVLIAKGEAVVIDGNYGLRVTEVAQHISATGLSSKPL